MMVKIWCACVCVCCLQHKKNKDECIYCDLCVLPPYQGSYDAFLVDFGKLLTKLLQNVMLRSRNISILHKRYFYTI